MKKLFLFLLLGCGSNHRLDTMELTEYQARSSDSYVSNADASDAKQEIAVCQVIYDECEKSCLDLERGSQSRKDCFYRCLNNYRLCTGCPLGVSNDSQ